MKHKLQLALLTFSFLLLAVPALAQEVGQEGFVGPGGCTTREECRAYCDIDNNKEECLTFAVKKGMMTQEEADKARKFMNQTGPGGCRGDECKDYCENPANTEECIRFAEQSGLIKPGEGARFRKLREISQKGGPGGCKGEACRQYCEEESRRDECFAFAKENGLLNQEQLEGYETGRKIERAIKEAGGPGGCKSERECHKYCSDPAKIEECAAFGAKHTGKSPEEMRRMLEEFRSGNFRDREGFDRDNEEFKERRQEFERRIRESSEVRERMMRGGYGDPEGFRPEDGPESFEGAGQRFRGPGGCDSPESCRSYCMNNPGECGFGSPSQRGQFEQYRSMTPPEGVPMPTPEQFNQYENYPPASQSLEPVFNPPPSEPQPTSYDNSKSFLANVLNAFLLPFKD